MMKPCPNCEKETDEEYRCHRCGCYFPLEDRSSENEERLVSLVKDAALFNFDLHLLRRIRELEARVEGMNKRMTFETLGPANST